MVVDVDRGHLLSVTMVGPGAAELLHSATVAVAGQVPIDPVAVPCFPTISELWLGFLESQFVLPAGIASPPPRRGPTGDCGDAQSSYNRGGAGIESTFWVRCRFLAEI